MEAQVASQTFWSGKRVLVTGHTGFKGSWLCMWLLKMGARVMGYGLPPYTERDLYVLCGLEDRLEEVRGDILDAPLLERTVLRFQPEIVFHLAAQPLVRLSYREPKRTFETNVMGTLHLLEALRRADCVRSAVMVTSDKCYENRGTVQPYRETEPMGGYDPYSASKGCMELLVSSWRRSFFAPGGSGSCRTGLASARAGNVIGGGDWSADRLIPDCVRALEAGRPITLRNPGAIRPWQFVLEPLNGYLLLAERLWQGPEDFCGGWNFGPEPGQMATVREMAEGLAAAYGGGRVVCAGESGAPHEASLLLLDSAKAKERLEWAPRLSLEETLRWTAEWYRDYREEAEPLCLRQIAAFEGAASGGGERVGEHI